MQKSRFHYSEQNVPFRSFRFSWLTKTRKAWGIFNISPICVTRKHDPRSQLRLRCRPSESQAEYRLRDLLFAKRFVICASPRVALCVPLGPKYRDGLSRYSLHYDGVSPRMTIFETPSPAKREADIKSCSTDRIRYKYFYLPPDASIRKSFAWCLRCGN